MIKEVTKFAHLGVPTIFGHVFCALVSPTRLKRLAAMMILELLYVKGNPRYHHRRALRIDLCTGLREEASAESCSLRVC